MAQKLAQCQLWYARKVVPVTQWLSTFWWPKLVWRSGCVGLCFNHAMAQPYVLPLLR